jgi:di/tricarboxylate transporter
MSQQILVYGVLLAALVFFVIGRPRYDVVALLALLVLTIAGAIPVEDAFAGFSHPAVVTVAAVLVASRGLSNAGLVDLMSSALARVGSQTARQVGALSSLVGVLSAFMNNIGALALLMPVPIQMARREKRSPSPLLMPLAFGSLLGGLVTLIGTPPNIIVSTFRAEAIGEPFAVFDFAPVGLGVMVVGIAFISLVGWRLIPQREGQASREEVFSIAEYTSELQVRENSPLVGQSIHEAMQILEVDLVVAGIARSGHRTFVSSWNETLQGGDVLIVEVNPQDLQALAERAGLELIAEGEGEDALGVEGASVREAVVMAGAAASGRTAREMDLRRRYGVNLLAVARQGRRLKKRLGDVRLRPGDVLLLQDREGSTFEPVRTLGFLPITDGQIRLGRRRQVLLALLLFGSALGAAATGVLAVEIALSGAAVLMVLLRIISLSEMYDSIDWPVIFLLGAILPVAGALETSGGADTIALLLVELGAHVPAWATLTAVLVGSMLLANLVNKAAAVLMAPIALSVAASLDASPDAFLMAVAIGASSAFLTPIGHQSNTLVMGPGGYKFSDYWRLGLPLSVLVTAVGVPLILLFWPL